MAIKLPPVFTRHPLVEETWTQLSVQVLRVSLSAVEQTVFQRHCTRTSATSLVWKLRRGGFLPRFYRKSVEASIDFFLFLYSLHDLTLIHFLPPALQKFHLQSIFLLHAQHVWICHPPTYIRNQSVFLPKLAWKEIFWRKKLTLERQLSNFLTVVNLPYQPSDKPISMKGKRSPSLRNTLALSIR